MRYYIKIAGGIAVGNPMAEDNLRAVYGTVPVGFVEFIRTPAPSHGVYEVCDSATYAMVDGVFTDVYHVRPMTAEEKQQLQARVKDAWYERGWHENGFSTWVFDEGECSFIPPIPKPIDGKPYAWNDTDVRWDEIDLAAQP